MTLLSHYDIISLEYEYLGYHMNGGPRAPTNIEVVDLCPLPSPHPGKRIPGPGSVEPCFRDGKALLN